MKKIYVCLIVVLILGLGFFLVNKRENTGVPPKVNEEVYLNYKSKTSEVSPVLDEFYQNDFIYFEENKIYLVRYGGKGKKDSLYQLHFNGVEIKFKKIKAITDEFFQEIRDEWSIKNLDNLSYKFRSGILDAFNNPIEVGRFYLDSSKKYDNLKVSRFDILTEEIFDNNIKYYDNDSIFEISKNNKSLYIKNIDNNIFDYMMVSIDDNFFLIVLEGTAGSGGESCILTIYEVNL